MIVSFIAFWPAPLGKLLPRPGRLSILSGAKSASSCLFAEANRKENVKTLPPKMHIQTVIFQRGDPINESTRLLLPNARKSKSNLDHMLFCNFFVFLRFSLAEGGLFIGFWDFLAGEGGLVGGFKNPLASLLRRLRNGLVSYLCWCCDDVVVVFVEGTERDTKPLIAFCGRGLPCVAVLWSP